MHTRFLARQVLAAAKPTLVLGTLLALGWVAAFAQEFAQREWMVEGMARKGLVYIPVSATTNPAPLIFAFHGHGGTMQNAARKFDYHRLWPEAIVVYLQGVNTPGRLSDPEGKRTGWQHTAGDHGDRDLKLFDTVLAALNQESKVDNERIYSTGHSNGGAFTYLLWETRGKVFAAVAPCAAASSHVARFQPLPVLHLAGEKDPLVKYEWQKLTIESLRRLNQCEDGKPWGKFGTIYPSKIGAPVVAFIHPGGHEIPNGAAEAIVKFFKEQRRRK